MRAWWSELLVPQNAANLRIEIGAFVGELGRAQPVDRIGARLAADLHELVADLVDRDVPGNPRPLAVHELHRIAQAAVAVHEFAGRGALGAVRAAVDRRIPARLLADPNAVDDFGDDGAADRAMRADVLADGGAGGAIDPAASALRTLASGSAPTAASPPTVRPERRRKAAAVEVALRLAGQSVAASVPRRAWRSVLLISMCCLPQPGYRFTR